VKDPGKTIGSMFFSIKGRATLTWVYADAKEASMLADRMKVFIVESDILCLVKNGMVEKTKVKDLKRTERLDEACWQNQYTGVQLAIYTPDLVRKLHIMPRSFVFPPLSVKFQVPRCNASVQHHRREIRRDSPQTA
jgi:hypothetical protein